MQVKAVCRQSHCAAYLQKPPNPAVGKIYFLFKITFFVLCGYLKTRGINNEVGILVISYFLKLIVKRCRVIYISCSARKLTNIFKRFIIATQFTISAFILAETFEKLLIRMHGDYRVKHDPEVFFFFVQVIKVF